MKKKLLLIITILFICPFVVLAEENPYLKEGDPFVENNKDQLIKGSKDKKDDSASYEYIIKEYDINMVVNENNTFDITENLTVYFNTPKHGIYRTIPKSNKIERIDKTTSENRAYIRNIKVNEQYERQLENGYLKLKIGDESKTIKGEKKYTISYNYDIGKDPLENKDELYFNLIGNYWNDTQIEHVTFKISLPKNFDKDTLGIYAGLKGDNNNTNIEYSVDDNIIRGSVNKILKPNEGLTVRLTLPEGYFVIPKRDTNIYDILAIIIPIIGAIISYLLWKKYGKDDLVVDTVEFYPPNDFDCLEIAYIDHKLLNSNDVTALLIVLANKGYLKIEETFKEKDTKHKHPEFKIIKLKEYDGKDEYEKVFFNTLFLKKAKKDSFKLSKELKKIKTKEMSWTEAEILYKLEHNEKVNEVTKDDLYDYFYDTVNLITQKVNTPEHKNKYYIKESSSKILFIMPIWIAIFVLMHLPAFLYYCEYEYMAICMAISLILFEIFQFVLGKVVKGSAWKALAFIPTLLPFVIFVAPMIQGDIFFLLEYIIGYICITIVGVTDKNMDKKTPLGTELYGKVQGFKNFLETAEKERLEAMVEENPSYFYDILPYTYVLGVSDKWMKNLEFLNVQAPDWYVSENAFSMDTFTSFMNDTVSSVDSAMTASPSSDSGGGGSVGGGSGGGGGGSW